MYQCRHLPIDVHGEANAFAKGRAFLKNWLSESPKSAKGRPYIWVKCFGGRQEVFLDGLGPHLEKKKPARNKADRYRLLPCVRELLEKSTDEPALMKKEGYQTKWGLVGMTPDGRSFWVIIGELGNGERYLNTCYRKY